jgi:hypothetical protein
MNLLTASDLDNFEIKIQLEHILDNKDIKERFRSKVGDYNVFTEEQLKTYILKLLTEDYSDLLCVDHVRVRVNKK